MALINTSGTPASTQQKEPEPTGAKRTERDAERLRERARRIGRQQKMAERLSNAASELLSGLVEAASAVEELKQSSEQIAVGAEESSRASQASATVMERIASAIAAQSQSTDFAQQRAGQLHQKIESASDEITTLISSVSRVAEKQRFSVQQVAELESVAARISTILEGVSYIADQTNLLALNAAIEASKAGKHGKGFTVIANEVRVLADSAQTNAMQIRKIVEDIQSGVREISTQILHSADHIEAQAKIGTKLNEQLLQMVSGMQDILNAVRQVNTTAQEASASTYQASRSAQSIAAAAEEQAAATEEASRTVGEQAVSLQQAESAARNLSELAEKLVIGTESSQLADDMAQSSQQLAAAVQELSFSASQIMTAMAQINTGTSEQAGAAAELVRVTEHIEKGAAVASQAAAAIQQRYLDMGQVLQENRSAVETLILGIQTAHEANQIGHKDLSRLGQSSRQIEKLVDKLTMVAIQTTMLAVNGAIEAARTPEAGQGFLLISEDIRALAAEAQKNAEDVKELIRDTQDSLADVRRTLEDVGVITQAEASKATALRTELSGMEAGLADLDNHGKQLQRATDEITDSVAGQRQNIDQIATTAVEARQAAASAAAAARQQTLSAEALSAAIDDIAAVAEELSTL